MLSFPSEQAASEGEPEKVASACTKRSVDPPPINDAGHPDRKFYEPDEAIPTENFDHVKGDGFVIVTYQPTIAAADLDALRQAVTSDDKAVAAGPAPDQTVPIIATTARSQLTCTQVDITTLLAYRDAWFEELYGARRAGG